MKDLPEDPPVWTPPPERWFDRHEACAADAPLLELTKTLSAMWLTLHDRMRLPLPTAAHKFTMPDQEMLRKLIAKHGPATMLIWRAACDRVPTEVAPEKLFRDILAVKGLYDE